MALTTTPADRVFTLKTQDTMKRIALILIAVLLSLGGAQARKAAKFITVSGQDLVLPGGEKFFIQGTNLGNWLNPEGYMFGFGRTNSPWMIDLMLRQLVGPDEAARFWQQFKANYITRDDLHFIRQQGANTVRLPFNYRLFTQEDYMGLADNTHEGFRIIDQLVEWCRQEDLYLILDMHDCPGGQTGDNIDDGYGYPWLFESEASQQLFCDIWQRIARHYAKEPVILGYELMNEPIAHYFANKDSLNQLLEPLYKRAVKAIRQADRNHIILLGGARWNSDFFMFHDWTFDPNIMYTCHRYGGDATAEAIGDYTRHQQKTDRPMYMGEIGHNSDEWQADFVRVMKQQNIGYTFWPYKKLDNSCMNAIQRPKGWREVIVHYAETPRGTFQEFRDARPDQAEARRLLDEFLDNCRFSQCRPQEGYIRSMGLKD